MDVWGNGKGVAVPEHLSIDVESLGLSNDDPEDPTDLVKLFKMPLIKIRKEIVSLAAVHPTTDEICQRVELFFKTTKNLQVSSNESFNYNKSSIMVYILFSFMSLTKICTYCFYNNLSALMKVIPMIRVM